MERSPVDELQMKLLQEYLDNKQLQDDTRKYLDMIESITGGYFGFISKPESLAPALAPINSEELTGELYFRPLGLLL